MPGPHGFHTHHKPNSGISRAPHSDTLGLGLVLYELFQVRGLKKEGIGSVPGNPGCNRHK